MFITIDGNLRLHADVRGSRIKGSVPVVFIHGFTGCADDWQEIREQFPDKFTTVSIDLPGHGKTDSPEPEAYYTADGICEAIKMACDNLQFENFVLLGYSMGGRAALSFGAKYPERLIALILESASPGITAADERKSRAENDEMLARMIEEKGTGEFADYWMNIPLFNSQKKLSGEKLDRIRRARYKNSITGLANSLRGFSTGKMPELWSSMDRIQCPVCLITGSMDDKFTEINRKMNIEFRNSKHLIIEGAGHNTHLEKPEVFLNLVTGFLKEITANK